MKKRLLFVLSLALVLCGSFWSCSADDPAMPMDGAKTSLLNEFLNSDYGIATLENHGLTITNLDLKNSTSDFFKSKVVTAFAIPIIENGRITGKLNAFIVPGDDSYRAIVEKWENLSDKEYSVTITTGYGMYLATVGIVNDGKRRTQKIMDIASYNDAEEILKSRSSKLAEESWWACTTRVYQTAKQACNGDSQCDFLCDLVDLAGGCTISMAAAAAIVCV